MKKFTVFFILFLFAIALMAQVPAGFSYQAVVRNNSGEVVAGKTVKFKFSILQNSATGTPVYVETQSKATNDFGLANLVVGSGTKVSGNFDPAGWGSHSHYLKVEIDPNNGNSFSHLGTIQLMAVPYAFHSQTAEEIAENSVTSAKIASAAITAPKLASMGATEGQVLKYNGTAWSNATDEKGPWIETGTEILYTGTKNVGIGIGNPLSKLALAKAGTSCYMSFQNSSTGFSSSDGIVIGASEKDVHIFNHENGKIMFGIEGSSGITLKPPGHVGIGTNLPLAGLHIKGNGFPESFMYIESNTGKDAGVRLYEGSTVKWHIFNNSALAGLQIYNNSGNNAIFCKQSNSFVGLGTTAPTQKLHVVGNAYKTEGGTSWATSSDLRLKKILGSYTKGLEEIIALEAVRFVYNENNPRMLSSGIEQVGFVAQDVQKIFPEAVTQAEDGYLDFNIHAINIALVNAVKELKAENDRLNAENREQNSRLEKLERLFSVSTQNEE